MNYQTETPNVEAVLLERFTYQVNQIANPHVLQSIDISYKMNYLDHLAESMVTQLSADVAGHKLEDTRHPADWKEAVKERWFPKWLLKRYPVKYQYVEVKALYPKLKLPPEGKFIPVFHTRLRMPREEQII